MAQNIIHHITPDHFFDMEWLLKRNLILMSIPDKKLVAIIRLVHGYSSVVLLPRARDNLILIAAYALALASPLYC
jgi:hypothetical protein